MTLGALLMQPVRSTAICEFYWISPTINTLSEMQFTFNTDAQTEFDIFRITIPSGLVQVLTTEAEMDAQYFPETMGASATASTSYNSLTQEYYITFEGLITTDFFEATGSLYQFFADIRAPTVTIDIDVGDLTCEIFAGTTTGTPVDSSTGDTNSIKFSASDIIPVVINDGSTPLAVSVSSDVTGSQVTMTLSYETTQPFSTNSWVWMQVPKANLLYNSGGNNGNDAFSLIDSTNYDEITVTLDGSSLIVEDNTISYTQGTNYDPDTWAFTFDYTGFTTVDAGVQLVIEVSVYNPPAIGELTDDWSFYVKSELGATSTDFPDDLQDVEKSEDTVTDGLTTATRKSTSGLSASITGTLDGVGVSGATYEFSFKPYNDLATETVMLIEVPNGIEIEDDDVSSFSMSCSSGCDNGSGATLSWDGSSLLTVEDAFSSYVDGRSTETVTFEITGWTNPVDADDYEFTIYTNFVESSVSYGVETITGFTISASEGICYVQQIYVTDSDTRIYGEPASYSFQAWCNHAIESDYGIKVTFPDDYVVMDRSSCEFTGYESRYYCRTYYETNSIEVFSFTDDTIDAQTVLYFTLDSIINPGTFDSTGAITFAILDSNSDVIDTGTYTIDSGYFTAGNITDFTVTPQEVGVGLYPVSYDFRIVPNGDLVRYSYLKIDLPAEIEIQDDNDFETSCGFDLEGFTNTVISCVVTNGGSSILIKDGFLYEASTLLSDDDGDYDPPDIRFSLANFKNPREAGYTGAWDVSIIDRWDDEIYTWDETDSPTTRTSGISSPSYILPIYENRQNGALSYLEFLVKTTGGLTQGDKIIVKLPFGWQFSASSEVYGRSNNLANQMEATISVDQRQISFVSEMSFALQRRLNDNQSESAEHFLGNGSGRNLQAKIPAQSSFQFRVTAMKNYNSFRPSSASIEYYVYSSDNVLFEEKVTGMEMSNNKTADLSSTQNGIVPGDFRTEFMSNYTFTVTLNNFEKNAKIVLELPEEIDFGEEDPECNGLSGLDVENLRCVADRSARTLSFTNALQFAQANPGEMRILIENLKNPSVNEITKSFLIKTYTKDDYPMDQLLNDITINFYCEYPCAECDALNDNPSKCTKCYQTAVERYFFEDKCLAECPSGKVETEELSCIDCVSPCITCDGSPSYCLTCIKGYVSIGGGDCREDVVWYFPFVGLALIFFVLIAISELVTKKVSNFKESLIAFWSIPEVLSWACLIYFMWKRIGEDYATALAALAAMMYVCINCVHAVIHPRYMVPNTLYSYKQILTDYKCGTFIARTISYLISYKFSLILVSYFFNSPRLKGDYSAMNWKQFNRFSMAFCLGPYLCMMASCGYFILTDGFWSYPGFVAVEVIFLSSIMTMLMLIDAISAIKCKTVGKRKTNKAIRVATGADYESDEDEINLRKEVSKVNKEKRIKGPEEDDFGDYYGSEEENSVGELVKGTKKGRRRLDSEHSYGSKISQQTQIMNEEARKQIAMLEELAHQMREEKRQLQEDKERIEREKQMLKEEQTKSQHHLEAYMDDYQRQTTALSNQVRMMERQKMELVQQVDDKISEGNQANNILLKKVQEAERQKQILANQAIRKNFRDFEGEMEDYEPVEEENSEDGQSSIAEVVDGAQLPVKPACGQIDYYRAIEGDDQHWMQQITPRAGGDSMLGQHDMEDDIMVAMQKDNTAHFEIASVPPSRYDDQLENGVVEAEYQEMTSQHEIAQSEMYQQRSDAEMEINSSVDEKDAIEQQWFEAERAAFDKVDNHESVHSSHEFFSNVANPVFEALEKPPTRHGVEQRYFAHVEPDAGLADKKGEMHSSTQHFFKQEPPTYGEVLEEGEMERQATAQHFFNPEKATVGDADDKSRRGIATPQEFIERTKPVFNNDVEDPNAIEAVDQRLFNAESAIRDDASDIGRSAKGSEMIYQEREHAFADKDVDQKVREGTEQQFFQREDAMYSQDRSMAGKNATAEEFFKHEEAMRGDITSQDKSVAATQIDYFKNVDKTELGRPDSFEQFKTDEQQDYMVKSDLGRNARAGLTTPIDDKNADQIDYMNKSEAEYGRQSTVNDANATQQKFFEAEKNPEFGRGDDFTRAREEEREYNPTPVQDSSGRSEESSEEGIANHQPFTSGAFAVDPNVEQVKKVLQGNPNARAYEDEQRQLQQEVPEASIMASPQKRGTFKQQQPGHQTQQQPQQMMAHMQPTRQPKTILYSDKSETSVEDLMDDTPSNYNIQNGRFEGKSLGLKALLLHAKNHQNQTIDATANQGRPDMIQGLAGLAEHQNRSPQHARPGQGLLAPGMAGAQKGIIGSQNDERQFVNNLYQTGQSIGQASNNNQWRAGGPMGGNGAMTVGGDDSSNNGDPQRNTRNIVRTNKQFVEDPRIAAGAGRGRGMPPMHGGGMGARSPQQLANRGRGGPGPPITKNNYFGGST